MAGFWKLGAGLLLGIGGGVLAFVLLLVLTGAVFQARDRWRARRERKRSHEG